MDESLLLPTAPTRKIKAGQLFAFTFRDPQLTVVGRVVRDDAHAGSFKSARFLVYVYAATFDDVPEDVASLSATLTPDRLLFPPQFTNSAGWSKGWFRPLGDPPLTPDLELPQHCFTDSIGSYLDEYGRPLDRAYPPVGRVSFIGFNGIALKAFAELGLTTRDGKTASHLFAEQHYR